MKILLHSSKTMKAESTSAHQLTTPRFITQATYLNGLLASMTAEEVSQLMAISEPLAKDVKARIRDWTNSGDGTAAALTFRGDIYSGLSAGQWDTRAAAFAQEHLLILSGLYGVLRPFDAIKPYRLEMGYKLHTNEGVRLDTYWERQLVPAIDASDTYLNLTANEYFKTVKKQLSAARVISPKFLTVSPKTGQPTFVTVHAKIARGSFANWLVTNQIDDPSQIIDYTDLNYHYDAASSTKSEPVFVCQEFGGLGLSVRLK